MGGNGANTARRKIPSWFGPAVVYAISLGCLIWVYRDFDWKTELPRLRHMHWGWIALAVLCDISVYVCQAWRWNLLLKPLVIAPLWRSVQAIYIGLFANEVLPLRSGEAIRCYLQSHWSGLPFTASVSSALIERLFDGIWLILGFYVTSFFVDLPENLQTGVGFLALLVGAAAVLFLFAVMRKEQAHDALERHRWLSILRHLVEGLHAMGRSRSFYLAGLASIPYLLLQVIPIYAIIRGYGLDLTMADASVVLVVLRLGTVIPGPPGNIGFFNAFAMLALKLLGVDRQTAKGLSGVMFFVITVPLLLAGSIALALTGLELGEIRKNAHWHMRRPKTPAAPVSPTLPRAGS